MGFFSPVVLIVAAVFGCALLFLQLIAAIRAGRERRGCERFKQQLHKLNEEADGLTRLLNAEEPSAEAAEHRTDEVRRRSEELRERLRRLKSSRIVYVYEIGMPDQPKIKYVCTLRLQNRRGEESILGDLVRSPLWDFHNVAEIWARDPDDAQRQVNLLFPSESGIVAGAVQPLEATAPDTGQSATQGNATTDRSGADRQQKGHAA